MTTVFLVDAKTGGIIHTYGTPDSPTAKQNLDDDYLYIISVREQYRSGFDLKNKLPIYITRTDYRLTSYMPNSNVILWNLSVSEIGSAYLCQNMENSLGALDYESFETGIPYKMPLSCQSRALVHRHRNQSLLGLQSMHDGLRPQDMRVPAPDVCPSQTNVDTSDTCVDPHVLDVKEASGNRFLALTGKFSKSVLLLIVLIILLLAACFYSLFNLIKMKCLGQTRMNLLSKRKRARKSVKKNSKQIGKIHVFDKEIAKGSNGTIVLEGTYGSRTAAVKRLVKAYYHIADKEMESLKKSDSHKNIVRYYGIEKDQDFVYLALERCNFSLNDLILKRSENFGETPVTEVAGELTNQPNNLESSRPDDQLWDSYGYPSPLLLGLMKDVVRGIVCLHQLGIVHRDLKPQNVLIVGDNLRAKISDMGISTILGENASSYSNATGSGSSGWQVREQLLNECRQTKAVDVFSLGCVLFFCVSGGRHPFGDHMERDNNIKNNQMDNFPVEHIPEAVNLFAKLLACKAELRPKASEVLCHPFLWKAEKRLNFLRDTGDRVESEDSNSDLLNALENVAPLAFGGPKWNGKMDPSFLNELVRYRLYKFDSVRDLLRVIRNKLNHYRELPTEIQGLFGPVPGGFDMYFRKNVPKVTDGSIPGRG